MRKLLIFILILSIMAMNAGAVTKIAVTSINWTQTVPSTVYLTGISGIATGGSVATFNRTSSDTATQSNVVTVTKSTTATMTDGFGPRIAFVAADADHVQNNIASIGATRSGSDAAGVLDLMTATAGTPANRLTISPSGAVDILTGALNMNTHAITNAQLGASLGTATVGPYNWCDYKTDGTNDGYQVHEAFVAGYNHVLMIGTIVIDTAGYPLFFTGSNQSLTGLGYSTLVTCASSYASPLVVINQSNFILRDFMMDGKHTALGAGNYGIYWTAGNQYQIQNIWIYRMGDDGIRIYHKDSLGGGSISNCYIKENRGYGLQTNSTAGDLRFDNNEVGKNYLGQVFNRGAGNSFTNNHFWDDFTGSAIDCFSDSSAGGNIWSNNQFDHFMYAAIKLNTSEQYSTISNNHMWGAEHTASTPITIAGDHNVIIGNTYLADSNVTNAIDILLGADSNIIMANSLGGKAVADAGASNLKSGTTWNN